MYKTTLKSLLTIFIIFTPIFSNIAKSEIEIKMNTTTIKGNTELPKILYIVPWQEIKHLKENEQQLIIHSLYDDLFNSRLPLKHHLYHSAPHK